MLLAIPLVAMSWMAKLKDGDKELQSALSYARFSPSDNNWSYVASNLNGASAAMATYWNERYKAASDVCTKLALGEKHPDLEKALEELGKYSGNVKGTVTQLKKDYNDWLREVRKLRKFTDDDRDAIRDAICSSGEYEMEAKVNAVADRWASQISGVYGTMVGLRPTEEPSLCFAACEVQRTQAGHRWHRQEPDEPGKAETL